MIETGYSGAATDRSARLDRAHDLFGQVALADNLIGFRTLSGELIG